MGLDRSWIRVSCTAIVVALAIGACAAHDGADAETVRSAATGAHAPSKHNAGDGTAGSPGANAASAGASFADVYAIIGMHCGGGKSGCHVTGSSAGLEMPDARAAYDHLVGVASMKCAGQMRVVPGDADASVLVQALEGSATCVKAMPLGRDPLSADEIETIRAWIDSGATYD
jgi:hypothetical protein